MKIVFQNIAKSSKYVRLQRNVNQDTAASEAGISLRTLQNIEAGKPVNSESLFMYLDYLDLLQPLLATLPDPDQLTPMEKLQAAPKRRKRASMKGTPPKSGKTTASHKDKDFSWGDSK